MYNHILYFAYWLVNSLIIFSLYSIFPDGFPLGNGRLTIIESSFYAGFWICFFVWSLWDFMIANGVKSENSTGRWFLFYIVNIIAVWVTGEFNKVTNFGPLNVVWVLAISLFANTGQILVWKFITKSGKTN